MIPVLESPANFKAQFVVDPLSNCELDPSCLKTGKPPFVIAS